MLGHNRIAGLFTVLFISNACDNLLQQPKPSILSFIATFIQAENCTEYCSVLFIYFPKVISCNNRFNCQQNTWLYRESLVYARAQRCFKNGALHVHSSDTSRYTANTRAIIAY